MGSERKGMFFRKCSFLNLSLCPPAVQKGNQTENICENVFVFRTPHLTDKVDSHVFKVIRMHLLFYRRVKKFQTNKINEFEPHLGSMFDKLVNMSMSI